MRNLTWGKGTDAWAPGPIPVHGEELSAQVVERLLGAAATVRVPHLAQQHAVLVDLEVHVSLRTPPIGRLPETGQNNGSGSVTCGKRIRSLVACPAMRKVN